MTLRPSVALLLIITVLAAMAGEGPGLPNQTWAASDVGTTIARFHSSSANGSERGHGNVLMLHGYLVVPFAADGGGGAGSGGFEVYDVSDPRNPSRVFTTAGAAGYGAGQANDATNLREPHSLSIRGDIVCMPLNKGGVTGLSFWNFADPLQPTRVGTITLPGLNGGDYDSTPWWAAWQGRYVYVAGTSSGVFIVDAADPAAPTLAARPGSAANPVPTSQLGGFRVNTVNVVGSLMVLTNADNQKGIATVDISDPLMPSLLWSDTTVDVGYSAVVNGGRLYAARQPVQVWDLADPSHPVLAGTAPSNGGKGGYGLVQDQFWMVGVSSKGLKVDASNPAAMTIPGQFSPSGIPGSPDWDFAMPLGNLVFMGSDHGTGSALMVSQAARDTTAPAVNMASPAPGATGVATTARIGLTFTDQLDHRTLTASNVILRPVGGSALATWITFLHGTLSVQAQNGLAAGTQYELVLPASGIKDLVGNSLAAQYRLTFTTAGTSTRVTAAMAATTPVATGTAAAFSGSGTGSGTLQYRWDFGDGTTTAFGTATTASHTYTAPGHYAVVLTVRDAGGATATASRTQTVHRPLTANRPTASSTVLVDDAGGSVWCVNHDAATVTAVATATNAKRFERAVGPQPRALARAADGTIWVACAGDDSIRVLAGSDGSPQATIALPYGSRPAGIAITPDGATAYVACEDSGRVLKLTTATRTLTTTGPVLATHLRGVAISHDAARVLVTRFISPDTRGEVIEVSPSTLAAVRTIALAIDTTADAEDAGRGLPNYLAGIAISPDGARAAIPAKKDNIQRGQRRDGLALTFESTVRTILCQIDLSANSEVAAARSDLNDRDSAHAVAWSPRGEWLFAVTQGTNTLEVRDGYSMNSVISRVGVGRAPQGIAVSADGSRVYVQALMSRSLLVFDTAALVAGTSTAITPVTEVATVATEPLTAQVLAGKRIFYNADDRRMNRDGYLSCATCHIDGTHDGRTWDFSDRGEGLRNTIELNGRRGTAEGRVHWSANFDEIQDFEHDMRTAFGGTGFLSDAQFNTGTRNQPLGDPKAGVSTDLDALAAYVASLSSHGRSPYRTAAGALTSDAIAGKLVFQRLDCASCHAGADFTDSATSVLHDVGTITSSSGSRLGQPLTGLDTPTLRGLWRTAPYLHDGSAATLGDVLVARNQQGKHGATAALSSTERNQLVAFLQQIDDTEPVRPVVALTIAASGSPSEAGATGTVTVTRSGSTADALAVLLQVGGTATAGSDYTALPAVLVIPAGQASAALTVSPLQDTLVEGSETVTVTLLANSAYTLPTSPTASLAIADDDVAVLPTLSIADAAITEGDSGSANVTLTVTLSAASTGTVTAAWSTANGTATAGSDYTAASGTVSFAAGQTSRTITVAVLGDTRDEADETFTVGLSGPSGATIARGTATVTSTDNDATPTLSIADAAIAEGDTGTKTLALTVTLSAASGRQVTAAWATANGTATAGSDYTAASGTVTFAAGETSKTVAVTIAGDTRDEADETFTVTLSSPTNATIARATATATITDDDAAPTLSIADAGIDEGDAGTKTLSLTVTLSAASGRQVTVSWATADGTATAGSDYTAASETVTVAAGETSKTVAVPIIGDTRDEVDETFTVTLSSPTNATIARAVATATIRDDDAPPNAIRINFQPATAPTMSGWRVDSGGLPADHAGLTYGWSSDVSATARDRNSPLSVDQRHDTLVHMQKNGAATWSVQVPDGSYDVTILAGDAAYTDSVYRIAAQGVLVVSGTPTSAQRWISGTQRITVSGGTLSVTSASGATNNKICSIEIVPVPIGVH